MRLLLTPALLQYLTLQGFKYCYSRTTLAQAGTQSVTINLTPVRLRPKVRELPIQYDTFFNLKKEPVQMVKGVDDTVFFVNLDEDILNGYLKALWKPTLKSTKVVHMKVM